MNSLSLLSRLGLSALSLLLLPALSAHADQWTQPTAEELAMTSQPQVPGAAAVYLNREEITEDSLHMYSVYVRLKVLTEGGKEKGDVELKYESGNGADFSIDNIAGRTIHPDGTVIPFTGKPYQKLVQKGKGYKYMAKVFSLPDVQVGSIIEYRYKLRYDDHYFVAPQWYVQSDLYTRKAHYLWHPTSENLVSSDERGQVTNSIAWTPILPADAKLTQTRLPSRNSMESGQLVLDLAMHDVPPAPKEEYMPPLNSFTYRVLFYYSPYRTMEDYWKNEGKYWARKRDKFIGPGPAVSAAVQQLVAPSDTQEQKLRKIYAAVQALENTRYTRSHSGAEDKALGFGEIHNTDDILSRKRGNEDQLAQLFVAMARAAGFKAYLMAVSNRDTHVFYPAFLSLSQLDDDIAIVNVDGKEHFFDPGSRFCPYGHLDWKHTITGGVRQIDGSATLSKTPGEPYLASKLQRVANLTMDTHGAVAGIVKVTFAGAPALRWRHAALEGDEEGLKRDLRESTEQMLPPGMEVTLSSIDKLNDYEEPLTVSYTVKGVPGSATGKRLLLPGDIFEAASKPMFTGDKREMAVYFEYGSTVQDAVRVNFPAGFSIESLPQNSKLQFQNFAVYNLTSESGPTSYTIRRNYSLGEIIYMQSEYPDLRTFYQGFEAKDQQPVILKLPAAESASANAGGN